MCAGRFFFARCATMCASVQFHRKAFHARSILREETLLRARGRHHRLDLGRGVGRVHEDQPPAVVSDAVSGRNHHRPRRGARAGARRGHRRARRAARQPERGCDRAKPVRGELLDGLFGVRRRHRHGLCAGEDLRGGQQRGQPAARHRRHAHLHGNQHEHDGDHVSGHHRCGQEHGRADAVCGRYRHPRAGAPRRRGKCLGGRRHHRHAGGASLARQDRQRQRRHFRRDQRQTLRGLLGSRCRRTPLGCGRRTARRATGRARRGQIAGQPGFLADGGRGRGH